MKEWDRVKKAAKKSVSVEEWLRLEDELKRAEKRNEELLSERDAGAGAAPSNAAPSNAAMPAAKPEIYGQPMANMIDVIQKKKVALQLTGHNWRVHGNTTSKVEEEMHKAVEKLEERYKTLEKAQLALDECVEGLVDAAQRQAIPQSVVDKLCRAVKDGIQELSQVKLERSAPAEVNQFMEQMCQLADQLAHDLDAGESAWREKAQAVIEALDVGNQEMQAEIAQMRAAIKKVPGPVAEEVFSPEFLAWMDRNDDEM